VQYTPVFPKESNILFMMTSFAQRQKEPFHALLIFDNICRIFLLMITNLKNDRQKWLQNKNNKKVSACPAVLPFPFIMGHPDNWAILCCRIGSCRSRSLPVPQISKGINNII
jgi:hypothetical protein